MEVGVEKRSKKKLVRSTWTGHVEKMAEKKLAKEQMPRKWRGNGGEEDKNCDGDCIEGDLERVGEECKNDRRNLLTEKVVREN